MSSSDTSVEYQTKPLPWIPSLESITLVTKLGIHAMIVVIPMIEIYYYVRGTITNKPSKNIFILKHK